MKLITRRWTLPVLFSAVLAIAPFVRAVTIDASYLIGTANNLPNSNPSTEVLATADIVSLYNSSGDPLHFPSGGYSLDPGTNVPAPDLPSVNSFMDKTTPPGEPTSLSIDVTDASYLVVKADGYWLFYYVGDLTGTNDYVQDVVKNKNGNGYFAISHYTLISGGGEGGPGVPDGGTTAGLLGLAMLTIGFIHRRFLRA